MDDVGKYTATGRTEGHHGNCDIAVMAVRAIAVFTHTLLDGCVTVALFCSRGTLMMRGMFRFCAAYTFQETHQEMRDPNVTSLYLVTALAFNALSGVVP